MDSPQFYRNDLKEKGFEQLDKQCGVVQIYRRTVPTGYTNETITPLATQDGDWIEAEDCANLCCGRGSSICQYAWLFDGKCYAVSCTADNKINCLPMSVSIRSDSVYIDLGFRWPVQDAGSDVNVDPDGGNRGTITGMKSTMSQTLYQLEGEGRCLVTMHTVLV